MSVAEKVIVAGGGIVFKFVDDEFWIMLIKRKGIWDLPKGKMDDGEEIPKCALREVREEAGIKNLTIIDDLGQTEHTYELNGDQILKKTYWFSMKTEDDEFLPEAEEDITEVAWFPVNDALKLVGYDNLKIVIKRFKQTL